MNQVTRTIVLLLCFVPFISGCMGGGTIGTGVMSLGNHNAPLVSTFSIRMRVIDKTKAPLAKARVQLENSKGRFSGITNKFGAVEIQVEMVSGEPFRISVGTPTRQYLGQEYISPAGQSSVDCSIVISKSNAIVVEQAP